MQRGKVPLVAHKKKKVWRISEAAPLGEFVDPGLPTAGIPSAGTVPVRSQESWATSSFDLLTGVEVTEEDPSTVPAELFNELFNAKKE